MGLELSKSMPVLPDNETRGGSYFVANYPPFSFWSPEAIPSALEVLKEPPCPGTPLGLYVHIPFCRKRCHFCYFKVYTDKNSSEIRTYNHSLIEELALYSKLPIIGDRHLRFIYFGGGTPSYLSANQLLDLSAGLKKILPWDQAEEITFECEPGTLSEAKLQALREMGVTRLSLGVENFNDSLLELNGRAHRSGEIYRMYEYARQTGFPQINIDLIAGMLGETGDNWRHCIEETICLKPDSVTIYQMEIPFNTTIYREMKASGCMTAPVADWETKRRWVQQAFEALEQEGYAIGSAYTAVRNPGRVHFVYRDLLWHGADMIALGVASFGHLKGCHFQNVKDFADYISRIEAGSLPLQRACQLDEQERFIREFILQMKLGRISKYYFMEKFKIDIDSAYRETFDWMRNQGWLHQENGDLLLSRELLLQVDSILHHFFKACHQVQASEGRT